MPRRAGKRCATRRRGCTRCHLYKCATQTVFGEGPLDARHHVRRRAARRPGGSRRPPVRRPGRPAVRPGAGRCRGRPRRAPTSPMRSSISSSSRAASAASTQKPDGGEIEACRWWLEQERALIRPPLTVALGATAARSLFGKVVTISAMRGQPHELDGRRRGLGHRPPSFLLRVPRAEPRAREYAKFVERPAAAIGESGRRALSSRTDALEPDQHLADIAAAEQVEEGLRHGLDARRAPSRAM